MRLLLTTLNARFIHSCLAIYCLQGSIASLGLESEIKEFTINARSFDIVAEIYNKKPDLIGFSVYIWNREQTLEVASILKKIMPGLIIILGGPEVSFDSDAILAAYRSVDYVVSGEGEETFPALIESILIGRSPADIPGVTWRDGEVPVVNRARKPIENLDQIPFPYDQEIMDSLQNRIVYYEASRGCPFGCCYCLSSVQRGVRYFSLERVKADLRFFIDKKVKQVKFVDRTFNCQPQRTKAILSYLLELHPAGINFHFEIAADILDEETVVLLSQAPAGLFQLEIGVQSTNPEVLARIGRRMDFDRVAERVRYLRQRQNVHLHLDLIAGLPGEDLASFERSFNDVFRLLPHQLQLGFLKVLKGTGVRGRAGEWGLVFAGRPPYEILETDVLPFSETLKLKSVADVLERFFNSYRLRQTLIAAAFRHSGGPFQFFLELGLFLEQAKKIKGPLSDAEAANCIRTFLYRIGDDPQLWEDLMKLDMLFRMRTGKMQKNKCKECFSHSFYFDKGWLTRIVPEPCCMLFDYSQIHPVTGHPIFQTLFGERNNKFL